MSTKKSMFASCSTKKVLVLGLAIAFVGFGCLAADVDGTNDASEGEPVAEVQQPITYSGHDYLFVVSPKTWEQARANCQLSGYDLVVVNDSAEEAFLSSEEARHGGGGWWIGYSDLGFEGTWLWVNGSVGTYSNWASGEPNNQGGQDCGYDNHLNAKNGLWDDLNCGQSLKFICERNSVPTSNTGSFDYAAASTNSATQNTADRPVQLFANQVLTVGTCGVPGAASNGTDTYLRLYNQGTQVASNDDSCGGLGSNFSFVAPVSATYTIRAGCFSSGSCNGRVAFTVH